MACGLVMVYSASVHKGSKGGLGNTYFLLRNGAHVLLGIGVMLVVSRVRYQLLQRVVPALVALALSSMIAVLVWGEVIGNSRRWLDLKVAHFQPAELAKVVLVVYLAHVASAKADDIASFLRGYLPPLIVAGLLMAAAVLQPDLGTAVILGMVVVAMLFVAGTRLRYVVGTALVGVVGVVVLLWNTGRWGRLEAFCAPIEHYRDAGWQPVNSLAAIFKGGLTGVGLGRGHLKVGYIPEAQTDFVMAVVGEELGLLGALFFISLYVVIAWRGFRAAERAPDVFGRALGFGLVFLLCVQTLINVAVAYKAVPTKGLTLPLVSYGGTSMLVTSLCIGVLLHLSRLPAPEAGSEQPHGTGEADPRRSGELPEMRLAGTGSGGEGASWEG